MCKISSSVPRGVVWSALLLPIRGTFAWVVMDVDSLKARNNTRPVFTFQERDTTSEVVHNKYFIPAIASMGGILIVVALCFWWLGWCGNRKKMAKYHAKSSYPTRRETVNSYANEEPQGARRSSQLSRKPVPSLANGSSVAGSPQAGSPTGLSPNQHVPPAPFNPAALYSYSNSNPNGHPAPRQDSQDRTYTSYHNGSTSGGQQPPYGAFSPSATSQASGARGFQPIPPGALAANIVAAAAAGSNYAPSSRQPTLMSVQHVNTSAAAAYANTYRNIPGGTSSILQQAQRPPAQPLVDHQSAAAAAAAMRMTSFSSDTSDTQVAAEPAPGFVYSPHAGNTLSYASSSDPSTTTTPGVAGIGVPPIPVPPPVAQQQQQQQQRPGQGQYVPQESYYTARSVPPPNSRQQTRFSEPESADDEGVDPYDGVKRGSSRLASAPDHGQTGSPATKAAPPPEYKDEKKRSESWYAQDKKKR